MAAAFTPEQLAMIERQRAYFASDDLIRERAALWADASPEECWNEVQDLCAWAVRCLDRLPSAAREAADTPDPLPPSTIALLEALQRR